MYLRARAEWRVLFVSMDSTSKEHDSGSSTPHQHHPHFHHRRLLEFVRPDGVRCHVALTPEEHEQLHKELSEKYPEGKFNVLINGTPEHVGRLAGMGTIE